MWIGAKLTLKRLLYDDSGVAVAYTVLVSLFIFMLCISTYAMSENIRQKMELQNACDAAAYSGAVVQADMLSRIAVLNRALSWTYAQTNMRQMDFIVDRWLQDIHPLYVSMRNDAYEANGGACSHGGVSATNGARCLRDGQFAWIAGCKIDGVWYAGCINLNGTPVNADTIKNAMGRAFDAEETNIQNGIANIDVLNEEIKWIRKNMNISISKAIAFELHDITGSYSYYTDGQWNNQNSATYITPQTNEDRFLNYSGTSRAAAFQKGYDGAGWWQLNSVPGADFSGGFSRNYSQGRTALVATCDALAYVHSDDQYGNCYCPPSYSNSARRVGSAVNPASAVPAELNPAFFGRAGSIVVTIKRQMQNPFADIFGQGNADSGLYAAFTGRGRDMWVISASRAGIRLNGDAAGYYRVHCPQNVRDLGYTGDVWNLCEEDWDAVMIPVNRAWHDASSGAWTGTANANELVNAARSALNVNTLTFTDVEGRLVH